MWYEGVRMGRLRLREALRENLKEAADLTVELIADPAALRQDVEAVRQIAQQAGLPAGRLTVSWDDGEPVPALDVDGMVKLLRRRIDVPGGLLQNILAELRAFERRLQAIREIITRQAEPFQKALSGAGQTDGEQRDLEQPAVESDTRPQER